MDLETLRLLNQDLLQRLQANQEEIKRRIRGKPASPPSRSERAIPESRPILKETRDRFPNAATEATMPISMEAGPQAAQLGLVSPREPKRLSKTDHQYRSHPGSPKARATVTPLASSVKSAGETCAAVDGARAPRRHWAEAKQAPVAGRGRSEQEGPQTGQKPDQARTEGSGRPKASARMPPAPKSILLTPHSKGSREKTKKEAGRVTFLSDPKEYTVPAGGWSIRPFLGYDWIAGLLDIDSSVSEKSEEYFSELQDFRQLNREACISYGNSHLEGLGASPRGRELDVDAASHECMVRFPVAHLAVRLEFKFALLLPGVFCYRLNKRLFATPLDPETACPICKTPRAQQCPETLVEPAFVRVSIPRSTLLPAYKHKIHRRKSYEPTDNLALPSHCLAGWENPLQAFGPMLSSLDLRSSSDARPSSQPNQVAPGILLLSTGEASVHWNSWQPWVCMCQLHKQARIRHFVVWGENRTRNLKASEFWQEKACSLAECSACAPEECPVPGAGRSVFFPQLSSRKPHDVAIPLPPSPDILSYDSLPVVDDTGDD